MKLYRRLLLCTLVLTVLVMGIHTQSVYAKEKIPTKGTFYNNITWTFNKKTGTLTLSGKGRMESLHECDTKEWKMTDVDPYLKKIVIGEGITNVSDTIGWLKNVKEIVTPASVDYMDECALAQCYKLKKITLKCGIQTIRRYSFVGTAIKQINIPNSVNRILEGAFDDCQKLEKIELPDSLKCIPKYCFTGTYKLRSIRLPDKVKNIKEGAFFGSGLTKITIPANVTTIGQIAFEHCSNLKKINIKSTKLKKIGKDAFKEISNEAVIKVPAKKYTKYKKILEESGLPQGVTIVT